MLRRRSPACLFVLALLLSVAPARPGAARQAAQQGPAEPPREDAPALLAPAAFLGYALGERFTPPHRVAAYVRHVAEASPRARLRRYGTTPEGRPLQLVTLSAPANLARLETIRRAHLRSTGLQDDAAASSSSSSTGAEGQAVVWLSYNIHGDEAVSSEAAMRTLHALADPVNAQTGRVLRDAVVLLDPCLNPDGRARYVQWYRQTRGARPDARPAAREHAPPWPSGRTNHYLFDLNRDWAWASQAETRARLAQYHRWMPHVHADFHEQSVDAPYYFAPGAEPMHEALTPFQRDFQRTMGRANARVFDREGWLYFTGQVFDLFYPGYGDTWPLFNGAVGMTYEQGGGGRAGLLIQTDADSLSLAERIAHHHATGLETVRTAARQRARLTEAFADYYRSARRDPPGEAEAYVVSGRNEDRARALSALLREQRIRHGFAAEAAEARGTSYATGQAERFQIERGDLVVPAAQPKARLARVLFERQPALADSITYDITAWALPFAYGMDAHVLPERPGVRTAAAPPDPGASPADLPRNAYAYLATWESLADARLLAAFWEAGLTVRTAREPFTHAGRRYGRGTLVVTRADNRRGFGSVVAEAAAAHDQPVQAVESGFTAAGPDFGSADFPAMDRPQIAVLAGEELSAYAVGEVWHFFDRRLGYPATLVRTEDARPAVLADFDVLVMPSGDYTDVFPEDERAGLRAWVEQGGRLVAMGRAATFLAEGDDFALERHEPPAAAGAAAAPSRYGRRERDAASRRVPGAVFRAALDATHPLAHGYAAAGAIEEARYYTLKRGADALAPLEDGWNVAVLPADAAGAPVSGFAGRQAQHRLAGSLVFGVEERGAGRVIYLADDPLFRGFWRSGMLLFTNAVFLVGQ